MPQKSIEQILTQKTKEWLAIPGVVGTATGLHDGKPCLKVYTSSDPHSLTTKIAPVVDGYPVVFEQTGPFRAVDAD